MRLRGARGGERGEEWEGGVLGAPARCARHLGEVLS